jgi:hypothetical protein
MVSRRNVNLTWEFAFLKPGGPGPGLKATIESIDNRSDFKVYMQNYAYAHGGIQRGPRRTGPEHEGFVSRVPIASGMA